ncbi:sugar phosphate nucleotidyltransferase [Candidatus Pelagibacter sp.]|jgi:glucose-1-phosphate cytidylyltransferase|nr:sugar phosphate nucleotidyltransferase [Candidatus Pelagibacter sp.]|tara:strand:+ start:1395 stop:2165 length:771 start_codon:yes stop_codon:yes gene_type:complete
MKIFILCGGFGTRLDFEGKLKAKPMVTIGNKPILYHIMKNFSDQNFNEFVLCSGNKSDTIDNYFLNNNKKNTKILKNTKHLKILEQKNNKKKIKINIVNTGIKTSTGSRIKLAYDKLKLDEDIIMTYGDGLSNVNIKSLIKFHYNNKANVTLTAVRPKQRYGVLKIKKNKVAFFDDSKKKTSLYINGGFFVISKNEIKKIKGLNVTWEDLPLKKNKDKKKLYAFKHEGFWASLDTLKDKMELNELYKKNKNVWKVK